MPVMTNPGKYIEEIEMIIVCQINGVARTPGPENAGAGPAGNLCSRVNPVFFYPVRVTWPGAPGVEIFIDG